MSWFIFYYFIFSSAILTNAHPAEKDPLNDFCRRWGHMTAVVDDTLYLDGGYVNWTPLAANPDNRTNIYLLQQYLNITYDGLPQLYANLTKNRTVNFAAGGALWPDSVNKFLYSFSGEAVSEKRPISADLDTYDILYNSWNKTTIPWPQIRRLAWGAPATSVERGEGYYLGGWMNNKTTPGFQGQRMMPGVVKFDMNIRKFFNVTGPDRVGRAEGGLSFLPVGDGGVLIYFGGVMDPLMNGSVVGSPMNTIYVLDLSTQRWYIQNATGTIPEMRRRFCVGATWTDDRTSFSIYTYGGLGVGSDGVGFADVYILSLPSFKWVKFLPTAEDTGSPRPRHSMTCNVVNSGQMLIIGGSFPNDDDCDDSGVWGTHNLHLNGSSPVHKTRWDHFYPNITKYTLPSVVVDVIGGSTTGGPSMLFSPIEWDNEDLPILFDRKPTFNLRTPFRPVVIPSERNEYARRRRLSILLGSVIGGTMLISIVFVTLFYTRLVHRRPNQPVSSSSYAAPEANHETANSDSSGTMVASPKHHELEAHEIVEVPNNVYIPAQQSTTNDYFKEAGGQSTHNSRNSQNDSPTREHRTYSSDEHVPQSPQSNQSEEGDYAYYQQLQRLRALRPQPMPVHHHCQNCGSPVELSTSASF